MGMTWAHAQVAAQDRYEWSQNRARRQSGFPTFIPCQRQDVNVLPERRQSHQGDKLCDVSTVPLVARGPVFLARGSDADGEPHFQPYTYACPTKEFDATKESVATPWSHTR